MNFRAFDFYGSNNSTSSWTNKVKCFHELRDTQHGINKLTTICNLDGELKKVKKSKVDFNQHLCMNSHKKLRSKEILILYFCLKPTATTAVSYSPEEKGPRSSPELHPTCLTKYWTS